MNLFGPKKSRETKKSRSSKGPETKRKILAHAMRIAAREGLAGLTIGRLAKDLGMSKSGLFAHFRSKRALEMATINEARMVFTSQVLSPATAANEGIAQLWVLCDSWLAHIERRVFPGGYFFTGAFFECAERSGAIEEEINRMAREWQKTLSSAVRKAQDRKEIDTADARRISLDLNGILMSAYWTHLVEKDNEAFREARIAVLAKLKGVTAGRVPANAFMSENAWREYLKGRHVESKKSGSIFRRLGLGKKTLPPVLSPPNLSSTTNQPPKKSESVFRNLARLTKR